MKITEKNYSDQAAGTDNVGKSKATHKRRSASAIQPQTSEPSELGSAKVNLSDRAHTAKKIREHIAATPDVDEAKVAKYKSMLSKGEYSVDARALADKMVDEHLKNEFFTTKDD